MPSIKLTIRLQLTKEMARVCTRPALPPHVLKSHRDEFGLTTGLGERLCCMAAKTTVIAARLIRI